MADPRPRDPQGRFLPSTRHAERAQVVDAREIRDPSAATQQTRWLGRNQPQIPEWDADRAIRRGQQGQSYVYRAVEAPAEAIAALPFLAGAVPPARPGDQADHDAGARLAQLLGPPPGGPNRHWSARAFVRWTLISYLVTGRAAWEIETAPSGAVVALWPLPVTELRAIPNDGGDGYWKRFEYGRADAPVRLAPEQVFYWWRPSQHDPREPESPLRAAGLPTSILIAAERYLYAFLENGAVPAALITTEAFGDDNMRQQFRAQWRSRYQGPENAGRVAFNEVGEGEGSVADAISVDVVGTTNKDAQLLQLHDAARDQVLEAYGTPRSVVGDASGQTFANAEAEWRNWWHTKLSPLAADFGDAVNIQLAPRLGSEVGWFDLSGVDVFQRHQTIDASSAALLEGAGIITKNEARAPFGLPPIPGGDELVVVPEPAALPAGQDDEPEEGDEDGDRAGPGGGPDGGPAGGGAPKPEPVPAGGGARSADHRADAARRARLEAEQRAHDRSEARRLLWAATDARLAGLERAWERAFTRLFARQAKATLARLTGNARSKRWIALADARSHTTTDARGRPVELRAGLDDLFPPDQWTAETREIAGDLYEVVVSNSLASVAGAIKGVSFDLSAPWVQDFIDSRANQLAGQVTSTTYAQIQAALGEGVLAGEGIDDLAERIRHVFDVAGSRATTIARTEVISAYNGAAVAGASSLPSDVVGGQEWIATSDGRTRSEHAAADGQTVAIGQPFMVGGATMAYPGDPAGGASNTVNCRCTVGFLTPSQMAEMLLPAPRVPVTMARAAFRLLPTDPTQFDEGRFRAALLEAA